MSKSDEKRQGATMDQAPPPAPAPAGTKTPTEWYRALMPAGLRGRALVAYRGAHDVAAAVHGWRAHKHHTGAGMQLTQDAYQKAIEGANSGRGKAGLHAPAISPHAGKSI